MKIYTYLVSVDGHHFATDSKDAVAFLCSHAKSTMVVEAWNDADAEHQPVPQVEFLSWSLKPA